MFCFVRLINKLRAACKLAFNKFGADKVDIFNARYEPDWMVPSAVIEKTVNNQIQV